METNQIEINNVVLGIDNLEFWKYLKEYHQNEIELDGLDIIKNVGYYAEFLFKKNKSQINKNEFLINCIKKLNNYSDVLFWLLQPLEAFDYLLKEVKNDNISLDDLCYYLDDDKIIEGFTLHINNYISHRKLPIGLKKKRLESLKKQRKLDEMISLLLQELLKNDDIPHNKK